MVMIVRSTAKSCAAENYDLCQKFQIVFFLHLTNPNHFKILIGLSDDRAKCHFSSEADRKDPDCN
mgnify:FL=1